MFKELAFSRLTLPSCLINVSLVSNKAVEFNVHIILFRSIGDFDLKHLGVVADADVTRISVKHGKDKFLVLTTG